MRLRDFSATTADGKPLYQIPKPRKMPVKTATVASNPAWWVQAAQLGQRDQFAELARARNTEMQGDAKWSTVSDLSQIGQL